MAQELQWVITEVRNLRGVDLWFDDGRPVERVVRGGPNTSRRLMAQTQGFLDITIIYSSSLGLAPQGAIIFFNDRYLVADYKEKVITLSLTVTGDGSFSVSMTVPPQGSTSGIFKKFPNVSSSDAAFIDRMIKEKYVPYQKIPDAPGKTDQEIRDLGRRFFPWSAYSYQLAMSTYDWTTASFARMVFMKVFQYTAIPTTPFPLDKASIALMIWESNWGTYVPSNPVFMNSFMMQPAFSLKSVEEQLERVHSELHHFSDVQNRLITAAVSSLPRTCIFAKPYLYSGQVDIYQMGMSRFGIGMLEFPGNKGPVGTALQVEFAAAAATFLKPGSIITTKMMWAFTDTEADAMHYSNGILLIVEPYPDLMRSGLVWDVPAYVTELSNDPKKTEYLFPPGSSFRVLSITLRENVQVIHLQIHHTTPVSALSASESAEQDVSGTAEVRAALAQSLSSVIPALDQVAQGEPPKHDHHVHEGEPNGRRCRCVIGTEEQK